jgi:hypothetical protein
MRCSGVKPGSIPLGTGMPGPVPEFSANNIVKP